MIDLLIPCTFIILLTVHSALMSCATVGSVSASALPCLGGTPGSHRTTASTEEGHGGFQCNVSRLMHAALMHRVVSRYVLIWRCLLGICIYPANTQRNKHVIITSKQRFDVIISCLLRCVFAGYIMQVRRSWNRINSTTGFVILIRRHLDIWYEALDFFYLSKWNMHFVWHFAQAYSTRQPSKFGFIFQNEICIRVTFCSSVQNETAIKVWFCIAHLMNIVISKRRYHEETMAFLSVCQFCYLKKGEKHFQRWNVLIMILSKLRL